MYKQPYFPLYIISDKDVSLTPGTSAKVPDGHWTIDPDQTPPNFIDQCSTPSQNLKQTLTSHAIAEGFEYKTFRASDHRYEVKCKSGECNCKVLARAIGDDIVFGTLHWSTRALGFIEAMKV